MQKTSEQLIWHKPMNTQGCYWHMPAVSSKEQWNCDDEHMCHCYSQAHNWVDDCSTTISDLIGFSVLHLTVLDQSFQSGWQQGMQAVCDTALSNVAVIMASLRSKIVPNLSTLSNTDMFLAAVKRSFLSSFANTTWLISSCIFELETTEHDKACLPPDIVLLCFIWPVNIKFFLRNIVLLTWRSWSLSLIADSQVLVSVLGYNSLSLSWFLNSLS